jgi:ribonuclease HI
MSAEGFLEEQVLKLLRGAAPGRDVGYGKRRKDGYRPARARIVGSRIVKYASLAPSTGGTLTFRAHPGDTLDQARQLYRSPSVVADLLALDETGWKVNPNFHFGYIAKGLCWCSTRLSASEYASYWMKRIDQTGVIRRQEWETELPKLVKDGILSEDDLACFDQRFVQTERELAIPRPGLTIERVWNQTASLEPSFSNELRDTFELVEKICRSIDEPAALRLQIWTDGSHTGYGVEIKDEEGNTLRELAAAAPPVALDQSDTEYLAVIWALREAKGLGATTVHLHSDSQFLVNRLNGQAEVNAVAMSEHYKEVRRAAAGMKVRFEWIEGETNIVANQLSRRLGRAKPDEAEGE